MILVNGPPRAGKTTVEKIVAHLLGRCDVLSMGDRLKDMTHRLYGITDVDGRPLRTDHFERTKDQPCEGFLGATPRDTYISVAENHLKHLHGKDVLGRLAVEEIESRDREGFDAVAYDCGFDLEARPVVERFGRTNCLILRVSRPGTSWSGDSRFWLDDRTISDDGNPVSSIVISNDGTEAELAEKVRSALAGSGLLR